MIGEFAMKRRLPAVLFVLHVTVLLLIILLASYSLAHAQGTSAAAKLQPEAATGKTPATPTATTEADRARFDKVRTEGFEALYNLDYETARARFRELARLYPDHPAGAQFLAASLWLETLNESRRLQSGLYNNESFYAKTEDKVDPKVVAQFKEWTRAAKGLAEARLKKNPKDAEALYFLGATQGLKAAFAGAVERSFVSALRSGSDAVDRHRETIKLDPDYHDAELTIGMQDYIVGGLALPYKILAGMTGTRGSKRRGLATLERVMREGRWARDDARVMLIPLYKREKRYADAAALARELAAKYPKNYLFKLEYADALVSQAATERAGGGAASAVANTEREAFAIFDRLLGDRATRDAAARQLDLIHFQYGEALFVAGQFERAAREFLAAASVPNAEANQATLARLRAAQTLDLAGRRDDALAQYKLVIARPNVYDSLEEARRGLREPYRKPAPKQAEEN
jgi:TolA-binding protein